MLTSRLGLALASLGTVAASTALDTAKDFLFHADGSINILTASVTALLALVVTLFLLRKRRPKGAPKMVPYTLPWFGHGLAWADNPLKYITNNRKKFGDVFSARILGEEMVFMIGSEAHAAFYNAKEEEISAAQAYQFMTPVFGEGIVYDCAPELLVQQRKMVTNGLTVKRFKIYIAKMVSEVEGYMVDHLGKTGERDALEMFNEVTVFTSTRCLHGDEVRDNLNKTYAKLYDALDKGLGPISFFFPYLPLPMHIRRNNARKALTKHFTLIVKNRRENNIRKEDMLQTIMEAEYSDGTKMTDHQVCGLMVALMLAGQHTSNVTLTWLLIHMAQNPKIFARVTEELNEHWPEGEELTYDKLKKCETLSLSVKETLRLRPPIILVMRRALEDWKYKDFIIPKGALACVSPGVVHRMPEYYTNPDEFDPDRFNKERKEDKQNKYSYLAFSAGRHSCIGEKFAYLQVQAAFAVFTRHYDFELMSEPEPDFTTMIHGPKHPVTIKYSRKAGSPLN